MIARISPSISLLRAPLSTSEPYEHAESVGLSDALHGPKKLVLLGASPVQSDAFQAARRLGVDVVICGAQSKGLPAHIQKHYVALDFSDIDAVTQLVSDWQADAVYSVGSDLAMPVVGAVAQRLGLPFLVGEEAARRCNDKAAMRAALRGLPSTIPAVRIGDGEPPPKCPLPFPVIVKPADAQGQRGVTRVDRDSAFAPAVSAARPHSRTASVIVERFIEGPELSVNAYLVDGHLTFLLVSDRVTWPQFTGLIRRHTIPSRWAAENDFMKELTSALLDASSRLGIHQGPVYAQVIVDRLSPRIIEITPRLDGCHMWRLIREASGIDLLEIVLRHLLFATKPVFPLDSRPRPAMLDFHCQPPGGLADYSGMERAGRNIYRYYDHGDMVLPVNGHFEKIGYWITLEESDQ